MASARLRPSAVKPANRMVVSMTCVFPKRGKTIVWPPPTHFEWDHLADDNGSGLLRAGAGGGVRSSKAATWATVWWHNHAPCRTPQCRPSMVRGPEQARQTPPVAAYAAVPSCRPRPRLVAALDMSIIMVGGFRPFLPCRPQKPQLRPLSKSCPHQRANRRQLTDRPVHVCRAP